MANLAPPPIGGLNPIISPNPVVIIPPSPRIRSEILATHAALDGDNGALGPRTSGETGVSGGSEVEYRNGTIYFSVDTGAHGLFGKIVDRYRPLGGPSGFLGFPTSGIAALPGGARICRFQHGMIAWDGNTGNVAREVHGMIAQAYDDAGGPLGFLGLPTTDETPQPGTDIRFSAFQHGVIVWRPSAGARVVPRLRLHIGKVNSGDIDDGVTFIPPNRDRSAELVTFHTVKVDGRALATNKRAPAGHAGTSFDIDTNYDIDVTPQTRIELQIQADDWDQITSNDFLGSLTMTFDITNFWGLLDGSPAGVYVDRPAMAKGGDLPRLENLRFNFSVASMVPIDAGKPFREQYWWRSDNFETADLSLDQYRDTFRDVGALGSLVDKIESPALWAYYELAYKHCAKNGDCFGMSLEAIFSRVGQSVFQEPLHQHLMNAADTAANDPATVLPAVKKVLNERHGWQLGAGAVRWLLSRLVSGESLSPLSVYRRVKDALAIHDYPVLSMVKIAGFEGHAVMPYRCLDGDGSKANPHKILVADPNVVDRQGAGDPTFVAVFADDTFEYFGSPLQFKSTSIIAGLLPGVLLVEFPLHRFGEQPRTAVWEVLLGLAGLLGGILLLAGDASTSQLSAGGGRLFRSLPDGTLGMLPGGILGMARLPVIDGPNGMPELYGQLDRFPQELQHEVVGAGNGRYQYALLSKEHVVSVDTAVTARAQETLFLHDLQTASPLLTMQTTDAPKAAQVTYASNVSRRQFTVDLPVARGGTARAGLSADAQSVVIAPAGPARPFVVELRGPDAKAQPARLTLTPVAGEAVQLRPSDWNVLNGDIVVERLSAIGGNVIGKVIHRGE